MQDTIQFKGRWRYSIPADIMRNSNLSCQARCLWAVLMSYVGPDSPQPFPSRQHLMDVMGVGYNFLKKLIEELQAAGLLSFTQETVHGRWQSCRYEISDEPSGHLPEVAAKHTTSRVHTAKSSGHLPVAAASRRWPKKGTSLRDQPPSVAAPVEVAVAPSTQAEQSKLALPKGQTPVSVSPVGVSWPRQEEEVIHYFEGQFKEELKTDLERSAKTYFRKFNELSWRHADGNVIWDWKGYAATVWVPRWIANRGKRKVALKKRSILDLLGS